MSTASAAWRWLTRKIDLTATPADGDVLTYDEASGKYTPQAASGGGSGPLLVADFQLTDAQIKGLPDSLGPVDVVDAPGAGLMIVPERAVLLVDIADGGAYTNIDGDYAALTLRVGDEDLLAQAINSVTPAVALLDSFLGSGDTPGQKAMLLGPSSRYSEDASASLAHPVLPGALDNQPLKLHGFSEDGNDYGGGNAANTLSGRVWYSLVPTVPFGA